MSDVRSEHEDLGGGTWVATEDLRFTFVRGRGPGGQAVNKLSTSARLLVAVRAIRGLPNDARGRLRRLAGRRLTGDDDLAFQSRAHRSQIGNRRACVERLRELVAKALVKPVVRKKKKVTRGMKEKRLREKKRQSEKKDRRRRDFGD
jgi:ribosome-associated protein